LDLQKEREREREREIRRGKKKVETGLNIFEKMIKLKSLTRKIVTETPKSIDFCRHSFAHW